MMQITIYHLCESDRLIPAYVGQTDNMKERWSYHRQCETVADHALRAVWTVELRRMNRLPRMVAADEVFAITEQEVRRRALKAELAEIRRWDKQGIILLNDVSFRRWHQCIRPDIMERFYALVRERHRNLVMLKHEQGGDAEIAAELGQHLAALVSEFPTLDVGHFYRFGGYSPHRRNESPYCGYSR